MLTSIGKILNVGILVYLGYVAASCMDPQQISGINFVQNPWILSFVGVVALFFAIK